MLTSSMLAVWFVGSAFRSESVHIFLETLSIMLCLHILTVSQLRQHCAPWCGSIPSLRLFYLSIFAVYRVVIGALHICFDIATTDALSMDLLVSLSGALNQLAVPILLYAVAVRPVMVRIWPPLVIGGLLGVALVLPIVWHSGYASVYLGRPMQFVPLGLGLLAMRAVRRDSQSERHRFLVLLALCVFVAQQSFLVVAHHRADYCGIIAHVLQLSVNAIVLLLAYEVRPHHD